MEDQGALLASSAQETPCPVSIHSLIPFFEGNPTVRTHKSPILSLSFFSNDVLLAGCEDGAIRMSFRGNKTSKPKVLRTLSTGEGPIHHVSRVGKRNEVVSGTTTGKVELWDLAKGTIKNSMGVSSTKIIKVEHLASSDRR